LRNLESLLEPATATEEGTGRGHVAGRERFGALLRELHAPELLALALLFHDIGKAKDREHATESVRMVQPALDRLKLPAEARHLVEFLIGNHLQMSRVAFRRDSEDPEVVKSFAALVGTEERLKMLCVMTLVDIQAVSPDTLTPWKEELLWRLYVDTYNRLTLAYGDDLIDHDSAGLAVFSESRPADVTEEELARFLDGLPKRYLALFEPERIYRHLRLARDIHHDEVHSFLEKNDEIWELTVVTLDKPYLFSQISGVLSYFGMNILRAQVMTTPTGLVLDVFEFTDGEAFLRSNAAATTHIQQLLQDTVAGQADVSRLLRAREQSVLYRHRLIEPVVHFDHEHSEKYTVVEIVADDAPGLLHRITRVISTAGCDVDLALISTEGAKAIDVLHVTKHRRKLSESERVALKDGLEQVLGLRT
jgi:[protein-PII] uridylyltransferase